MKYLFVLFSLLIVNFADAQREMWGMTKSGGIDFQGVLFKTDKTGKNLKIMHYFDSATGTQPQGSLIQARNGKLYGFTSYSTTGYLTNKFFEFDPITNIYKIIINFDSLNYSFTAGAPFLASNGNIYSLCYNKLVEYNVNAGSVKIAATLPNNIYGDSYLMQASDGNLYFATQQTISVGTSGALFRFNPNNYSLTKLYTFVDHLGGGSYGSLIELSPGLLCGTFTRGTDSLQYGGVFTYNLTTNYYAWKALLGHLNAIGPYGGLTKLGNKLYGTTFRGGGWQSYGTIFFYDPSTNYIDTIHNFITSDSQVFDSTYNNYISTQNGWGTDLVASNGLLYGMCYLGCIFSFDPTTNICTPTTGFFGPNGSTPFYAHLIQTCTKPYYFTTIPDTIHVLEGQPFSFTITTPNTDTFRWVKDTTHLLPLQKDSTLHIDTAKVTDMGWYTCRLTNECGDSITRRFYLKVDIVTPLDLVFTATQSGKSARLQWKDGAPNSTAYYEVQRSTSAAAGSFALLTKVTATTLTTYTYTDENIFASPLSPNSSVGGEGPGVRFCYRLKQVAKDGTETYTQIICLSNAPESKFTITPNPASSTVSISIPTGSHNISIAIADSKGAIIWQKENLSQNQTIDIANWADGTYSVIFLKGKETVETKKLVVVKK